MTSSLRVGIVGLGFGARVHLPAFQSLEGVEVVALAGSGRPSSTPASADWPPVVKDWRELAQNPNIDILTVAAPPAAHAQIVLAALAAGKHVLCEKPFGVSLDEATNMVAAAADSPRIHVVGYEFRMQPGLAELKRQVSSGAIGMIQRVDVTWLTGGRADPGGLWSWQHDAAAGGGVLEAFGSHVLDYVEWICQDRITRVMGHSEILISERRDAAGTIQPVTAEDSCDLLGWLDNGAVLSIHISNVLQFGYGHRIEITGESGRVIFAHQAPFTPDRVSVHIETTDSPLDAVALHSHPSPAGFDTRILPFLQLARSFVGLIRGELAPDTPDFRNGLRVRKILHAAHESCASRVEVSIPG